MAARNLLIATVSLQTLLGCGYALAQEAATELDSINIQERVESAFGPVDGYEQGSHSELIRAGGIYRRLNEVRSGFAIPTCIKTNG